MSSTQFMLPNTTQLACFEELTQYIPWPKITKDIADINHICLSAGNKIMHFHRGDYQQERKADNSVVTQADFEADTIIQKGLADLSLSLPVLSEEKLVDWQTRKAWGTYWLVDPLDGTKSFVEGKTNFTVNIALIHENNAILGFIYAPFHQELFIGSPSIGSYRWKNERWTKLNARSKPHYAPNRSLDLLVSTSYNKQIEGLLDQWQIKQWQGQPMGSSIKFCRIAEGQADLYPRLKPTSEWDTAAGQAILEGAGGKVMNLEGIPLNYNTKEDLLNPWFIASAYLEKNWFPVTL